MSGTLSTRWFWSDWMSDPGLRACGYAARGLWKDMLCIAGSNKGKDYGCVMLNGKTLDAAGLAKMTGGASAEVESLIAELEKHGVFSRDRRKVIYCRRMVRAQKNKRNGRLGGNPNLLKTKAKQNPVIHPPKSPLPEPEPVPEYKNKTPPGGGLFPEQPARLSDWPTDYRDQFWSRYPRKTEKKAALAKLDAIKKGCVVPWAAFIAGVERHAEHSKGTEERYVKHPTTWLNRGCWDDEYGKTGGTNGGLRGQGRDSKSAVEAWDRLQGRVEGGSDNEVREAGVRRLLPG